MTGIVLGTLFAYLTYTGASASHSSAVTVGARIRLANGIRAYLTDRALRNGLRSHRLRPHPVRR